MIKKKNRKDRWEIRKGRKGQEDKSRNISYESGKVQRNLIGRGKKKQNISTRLNTTSPQHISVRKTFLLLCWKSKLRQRESLKLAQ